jgi:hypothetical protein
MRSKIPQNQKVMEALNVDKSDCHHAANIDKTSVGHVHFRRWSHVLGVQEGDNFGTVIAVVLATTNKLSSSSWGMGCLTSNSCSIKGRIIQLGDKSVCHHAAKIDKTYVGHAHCRSCLGVQEGDNFGTVIAVVLATTNKLSSSSWGLGCLTSNSCSIEGRIIQLGDKSVCHHAAKIDKMSVGHEHCRSCLGVQEGDNFGTVIERQFCCSYCHCVAGHVLLAQISKLTPLRKTDVPALLVATVGVFIVSVH